MKNIHILLTDKPSRLTKPGGSSSIKLYTNGLTNTPKGHCKNYHLYITSDEEIKEGDWHFNLALNLVEKTTSFHNGLLCEKIILTTDQDLIKNGVQEIDKTFLEWFVKNPSCEFVKTDLVPVNEFGSEITVNSYGFDKFKYKIIIPQEEPKQEKLEEYAERLAKAEDLDNYKSLKELLIHIAEWQSKRKYSEEDLRNAYRWGTTVNHGTKEHFNEWFEQFKKK